MAKEIIVNISPAGVVKIEAKGFNGVGCAKATESIELVLGGDGKKKKTPKPEYYSGTGASTQNKNTF